MTADDLRDLKNKTPFTSFTIHMNGGQALKVEDSEDLVIPRGWHTDAIMTHPRDVSRSSTSGMTAT